MNDIEASIMEDIEQIKSLIKRIDKFDQKIISVSKLGTIIRTASYCKDKDDRRNIIEAVLIAVIYIEKLNKNAGNINLDHFDFKTLH